MGQILMQLYIEIQGIVQEVIGRQGKPQLGTGSNDGKPKKRRVDGRRAKKLRGGFQQLSVHGISLAGACLRS